MNESVTHVETKAEAGQIPDQRELERELSDYLSKKYGNRVKIVSPFVFPRKKEAQTGDERGTRGGGQLPLFDMLPEELASFLDSFVVKQHQAKAVLATKVCTHFNRVRHLKRQGGKRKTAGVGMIKNNVLMIGPTGVGKTYLVKLIAQKLGVPFVKGDATKFSETGYVGGDVEDLVRDLVYEAKDDVELAENGIIYVDEIDKIASSRNLIGHDVSRTGVQRALLKPMEETEVDLKVPHDPISQIQAIEQYRKTGKRERRVVNTKNILFIMSGAFGDLTQIIRKRLQSQGLGFEADVRPNEIPWDILREVTAQDLIEFGFESEFVGRLPVIVVFDELQEEDLVEILKNPNNPIVLSKRLDFNAYGISLRIEEEALRRVAQMAAKEKTGARALVSVMERILIPFEKHLPSTRITQFLLTPEAVEDPKGELDRLLADSDSPERLARFEKAREWEKENLDAHVMRRLADLQRRSGLTLTERKIAIVGDIYFRQVTDIETALDQLAELSGLVRLQETAMADKMEVKITLDESAVDALVAQALQKEEDPGLLTYQLLKRLEYGLRLVKDRSGVDGFILTAEAVTDMESFINRLIKQYYKQDYELEP